MRILALISLFFVPAVSFADEMRGHCRSARGDSLSFSISAGKGELLWQEKNSPQVSRSGEGVFDELYKVFVIYFEDGRFLVEPAEAGALAYAKLSLDGGKALNLTCRRESLVIIHK